MRCKGCLGVPENVGGVHFARTHPVAPLPGEQRLLVQPSGMKQSVVIRMYAEVVDQTCDLVELQGVPAVNAEYFLEYVILHAHVMPDEKDDVLDEAYPQDGEVAFEEDVQVLVGGVEQQLMREHVELHAHRPRRLLAVALEHAQTADVHDSDAILQVLGLSFVHRWQVQAVELEVRHAEKYEPGESVRLQVPENDLANVPADVQEVVDLENVFVNLDKSIPLQCTQDVGVRTRKEVRYDILVEVVILNFVDVRFEQESVDYTKKFRITCGFVHFESSPCYDGLCICVVLKHMPYCFSGNRGFGKSSM